MALPLLCTASGQNKAGVGQKVPRNPQQMHWDPPPLPSQGGYSGEWDGMWVGGELLEEDQEAPLPLWH